MLMLQFDKKLKIIYLADRSFKDYGFGLSKDYYICLEVKYSNL